MTEPIASIVIPAHDEEAVIGRCLEVMLSGSEPGELEIVVACNGCTDRTAEIARSFGPSVRVVETPVPSKIVALNLGDASATSFPRFYVDADIVLPIAAIRKTASLLGAGQVHAAGPRALWDLSRSNWLVRSFYRVWKYQPYFDRGQVGAGVYAVSEVGHARLDHFPDITADDEYVRRLFGPHERSTVEGAFFTITPPRRLRDLVRIKTRSRRGNRELSDRFPHLKQPKARHTATFVARILSRPVTWPAVPVYLFVVLSTIVRSRLSYRPSERAPWERDLSSRAMCGSAS